MGYYSDVAIGMSFKDKGSLAAFLSYVRLGDKMPPEELARYTVTDVGEQGVLLHAYFDSVKWNEYYPDVKCHTDLRAMARESGAGTAYLRIGENYDDIEEDITTAEVGLDLYELFGVSRTLIRPDTGDPIKAFLGADKE